MKNSSMHSITFFYGNGGVSYSLFLLEPDSATGHKLLWPWLLLLSRDCNLLLMLELLPPHSLQQLFAPRATSSRD